MNEFSLEKWELPPRSETLLRDKVDAAFEMEWRGKVRSFGVRLVRSPPVRGCPYLFIHEEGEQGSWVGCTPDGCSILRGPGISTRLENLEQLGRDMLEGKDALLGRIFFSSEFGDGDSSTLVLPTGEGIWRLATGVSGARFQMSQPYDGWLINAAESFEILMQDWKNKDSDTHFAWYWSRLNDDERIQIVAGHGYDFDQLKEVMTWVLQSTDEIWREWNAEWKAWYWQLRAFEDWAKKYKLVHSPPRYSFYPRDALPRINLWNSLLFQYVAPVVRTDLVENHRCVSEMMSKNYDWTIQTAVLRAPPTADERAEALSHLHEWLCGKVSDEEAARLLAN